MRRDPPRRPSRTPYPRFACSCGVPGPLGSRPRPGRSSVGVYEPDEPPLAHLQRAPDQCRSGPIQRVRRPRLAVHLHPALADRATRALQRLTLGAASIWLPNARAEADQIAAAVRAGARVIELHTGAYADAADAARQAAQLERLRAAIAVGVGEGLRVNAGHGLHYDNVQPIAALPGIAELNIGHAIVAQAVFDGWEPAIRRMKALMIQAARP